MKETFGDRVKRLRNAKGFTQEELARKAGYKDRSSVAKIEAGERNPSQSIVSSLAKALGTTPARLMGWEEESVTVMPNESVRMIPMYESVSAGFGAYADDYITGYMPIYISNNEEAENTMCVKVTGNSMYPKIEDGDHIQVLKQDWCEDGQIAVVLIDGEDAVVKKVEYDNNSTTLISINPEYEPRVFKGAEQEDLRILGVVRKIIKDV